MEFLLYNVSEQILLIFTSVKVCGYWFGPAQGESLDAVTVHHPNPSTSTMLPQFLDELAREKQYPLYISFGSMEELGFFSSIDSVELLGVLNEGWCRIESLSQFV